MLRFKLKSTQEVNTLKTENVQKILTSEHECLIVFKVLRDMSIMNHDVQSAQSHEQHKQVCAQMIQNHEQHEHQNEARVYKVETRHF